MDTNGMRKVEAEAKERLKSRKPLGWPRERERLLYENEQLEAQVARLREALVAIYANAEMIVDTQTTMKPAHRALVQMIADRCKAALSDIDA